MDPYCTDLRPPTERSPGPSAAPRLRVHVGVHADEDVLAVDLDARALIPVRRDFEGVPGLRMRDRL